MNVESLFNPFTDSQMFNDVYHWILPDEDELDVSQGGGVYKGERDLGDKDGKDFNLEYRGGNAVYPSADD